MKKRQKKKNNKKISIIDVKQRLENNYGLRWVGDVESLKKLGIILGEDKEYRDEEETKEEDR